MFIFIGFIVGVLCAVGGVFCLSEGKSWVGAVGGVVLLLLAFSVFGSGFYFGPHYSVWQQGMSGRAELSRAGQNRQIRVEEARALFESAKLTAKAEIERAKGVAEANTIIADGLGGAEGYLRWRYIEMLEETGKSGEGRTIIYIPTEAGLPILEAKRLGDQD